MNRNQLEIALKNFLSENSNQKVLLLKGDWGVGKSFFLEEFLKKWGKNGNQSIGITSLFGISEFKHCLDRLHFPAAAKSSLLKNGFQFINKYRKFIPTSIPSGIGININLDQIFQTILSTILKDGVLVIDDIERKNENLSLEEVLGATSYLAEKQLKRVIIVFSESNLNDNDKKAIDQLREKTVDIEYTFTPSSQENATLILSDKRQIEIIATLDITNIRLIRKIKVAWDNLVSSFKFKSDYIKNEISHSIAILSIIYFTKNKYPFKVDDLINYKWLYIKDEKVKTSFTNALKELKYEYDEREMPIIDYLKNGQFETAKWQDNIDSFEINHQSQTFRNTISEIWQAYNGNFNCSYAEVVRRFTGFLNDYCEVMYPSQIIEMLTLFDKIGYDHKGSIWLEKSIVKNLKLIGIQELQFLRDKIENTSLISSIENEIAEKSYKTDLGTALNKVVQGHGWSGDDGIMIQNATVNDYESFIKKSKDEHLLSFLRSAYKSLSGFSEEGYRNSAKQLKAAAYKIVDESIASERKLNEYRAYNYIGPRDNDVH